jgi:hypothetical protein
MDSHLLMAGDSVQKTMRLYCHYPRRSLMANSKDADSQRLTQVNNWEI